MIILGVVVAVWLGERRWVARGGESGTVLDVAVWAVPFGLIGGRLYHVITDNQLYFGHGRHPIDAVKIWNGGLGIWGAVALGTLGAYLGCRRRGVSFAAFADVAAPGVALAQAIGRWGNWFNQELYGRPTKLPWAVRIDPAHRPVNTPDIATYHPTFLYESLWCVGVAILVIWAEKRFRLTHGCTFALYVAAYTVGRAWIEWLRVDEAHHILGLRLNDWTSLVVFLGAAAYLYVRRVRTRPDQAAATTAGTEAVPPEAEPAGEPADEAAPAEAAETAESPTRPEPDAEGEAEAERGTDAEREENAEQGATSDQAAEPERAAEAGAETEAEAGEDPGARGETDADHGSEPEGGAAAEEATATERADDADGRRAAPDAAEEAAEVAEADSGAADSGADDFGADDSGTGGSGTGGSGRASAVPEAAPAEEDDADGASAGPGTAGEEHGEVPPPNGARPADGEPDRTSTPGPQASRP